MTEQGFGCMGWSAFYSSSITEEKAVQLFKHAVDSGVQLFNTATFYGPLNEEGFGANLRLLRKCIAEVDRSKIKLMVKICMDTRAPPEQTGKVWNLRGDAEGVRSDVDYALETLGVDYIDIIVLCRVSQTVPIEETVAAMALMVEEGKARHIGLSEASAPIIRRAYAVAPIYCIEQEWSLWTRDLEEDIVPTCRELGIKIVAYSPLGRGFLTGQLRSRDDPSLGPNDYRLFGMPRFSEENLSNNLLLVDALQVIANKYSCTVGQLALAWLHAQGPDVIPIPGTSSVEHMDENLAARSITLSTDDLQEINTLFPAGSVAGDRYAHMGLTYHANKGPAAELDH